MSYFPDVRTDETYSDKKLKGGRKDAVIGFDIAAETVDCLFANLDVYPELEDILDPNKAVVNVDKVKIVREAVAHWLEMKRNEMVTAFLDEQFAEDEKNG